MKRFEFSLQSVYNLREQEEQDARIELGKKTAACEKIRQQMKTHLGLLNQFQEEQSVDWLAYQAKADFVTTQNHRLTLELEEAEKQRQKALGVYQEAMNRKKVFEKLRERKRQEFLQTQRERENKNLDDLFSSRETYKRSKQG